MVTMVTLSVGANAVATRLTIFRQAVVWVIVGGYGALITWPASSEPRTAAQRKGVWLTPKSRAGWDSNRRGALNVLKVFATTNKLLICRD